MAYCWWEPWSWWLSSQSTSAPSAATRSFEIDLGSRPTAQLRCGGALANLRFPAPMWPHSHTPWPPGHTHRSTTSEPGQAWHLIQVRRAPPNATTQRSVGGEKMGTRCKPPLPRRVTQPTRPPKSMPKDKWQPTVVAAVTGPTAANRILAAVKEAGQTQTGQSLTATTMTGYRQTPHAHT